MSDSFKATELRNLIFLLAENRSMRLDPWSLEMMNYISIRLLRRVQCNTVLAKSVKVSAVQFNGIAHTTFVNRSPETLSFSQVAVQPQECSGYSNPAVAVAKGLDLLDGRRTVMVMILDGEQIKVTEDERKVARKKLQRVFQESDESFRRSKGWTFQFLAVAVGQNTRSLETELQKLGVEKYLISMERNHRAFEQGLDKLTNIIITLANQPGTQIEEVISAFR